MDAALFHFQNNWFLRGEEAPRLGEAEAAFVRAALGPAPQHWDGEPDEERMAALLAEHPNVLARIGRRLLTVAIGKRGCGPAVEVLLANGVPFEVDQTVYNVMHEAAWAGSVDTLQALFESGVVDATGVSVKKPHVGWPDNISLLYWAAWRGTPELAKLLIRYGAGAHHALPIKGNGERGTTSLQEAVAPDAGGHRGELRRGKLAVARVLIEDGAPYDVYAACGLDDLQRLLTLAEADPAIVNAKEDYGMTPLHWAARACAMRCLEVLLEQGADVHARNKAARSPLHLVAETGPAGGGDDARQAEAIRLFAKYGADLDAQDKKGRTPLHRATYEGRVAAAEALLEAGADPFIPNKSGKNAFAIARKEAKYLKARA